MDIYSVALYSVGMYRCAAPIQKVDLTRAGSIRRYVTVLILFIALSVSGIVAVTAATLDNPDAITPYLPVPNRVGYAYHAAAGTLLNVINASPKEAAIQWVKAASHARSMSMVRGAATGLARARQREGASAYFDTTICAMVRHGSPFSIGAVRLSGIHCSASVEYRIHVAEGSPITYDSRPPIGGPHYARPYPSYGIVEHPVLPGYWVHNLEHGAIVLLYNCPNGCPDLIREIHGLYSDLPGGGKSSVREPRLLVIPYADMDHRIAVVAWDHLLELDAFDSARIIAFYNQYIDRGPECTNIQCPP